MKHILTLLLCHMLGVTGYRTLPRTNLIKSMLAYNQAQLNSIEPYQGSNQPQPHVTCTGLSCTYAFTVSAENQVTGQCNKTSEGINKKISELSTKLDNVLQVIEQKSSSDQVEVLQHQITALESQLESEKLKRAKIELQLKSQTRALHRYRQNCKRNETHSPAAIQTEVQDCQDVYSYVSRRNGVYDIYPKNGRKVSVYCEDGWTVFQHREDGTVDFDRDWQDYKRGFGRPSAEHWLGNEMLHRVSSQKKYKLMVEIGDWDGRSANAIYESFKIDNEEKLYRLHIGEYVTGSGRDGLRFHENIGHGGSVNGMAFSTRDRDNDRSVRNCAKLYNGGWWYNDCFWSNLNGQYVYKGGVFSDKFSWFPWKMNHYSLKMSKMKLKPT